MYFMVPFLMCCIVRIINSQTAGQCGDSQMSKERIEKLRDISKNLQDYFEWDLVQSHESMQTVLTEHGEQIPQHVQHIRIINSQTAGQCGDSQMSKERIEKLRDISKNLQDYFERDLVQSHESMQTVLTEHGEQIPQSMMTNDPLEKYLLQAQLAVGNDLKKYFEELKHSLENLSKRITPGKERVVEPSSDCALKPTDCADLLLAGYRKSGVYKIYPFSCFTTYPIKVYCDMETDGGGWTVFLARMKQAKQLNFTQDWKAYKRGFGDVNGEYWLGNEILHLLTKQRRYSVRMDAEEEPDKIGSAKWNYISVDNERKKYRIKVDYYDKRGSVFRNYFSYHTSGVPFSTFDKDNDKSDKRHCAEEYQGGWWYYYCAEMNPTGIYGIRNKTGISFYNQKMYPTKMHLKIRPIACNIPMVKADINYFSPYNI